MTRNFNECLKTASGNIITPKGRMMYPALFKPTLPMDEKDESKARYQVSLLFPKTADLSLLAKAIDALCVEKWGADYKTKLRVRKPFLKSEDYPKMGAEIIENFPMFIRTNSKDRPGVVRADTTNVGEADANEVYGGRWACISVRPYAYDHKTGGKGISLGLQNVQVLDHDDVLGGSRPRPEDEFTPVGAAGNGGAPATSDDLYT